MLQAFDDVWAQMAPEISTRPKAIEAARIRLANIVIGVARGRILSAAEIKDATLRRFGDDIDG